MGWWRTGNGDDIIGDGPADRAAAALREQAEQAEQRGLPLPTLKDLLDALIIVLREPDTAVLDEAQRATLTSLGALTDSGAAVHGDGAVWIDAWRLAPVRAGCDRIVREYRDAVGRPPRLSELLRTWKFVLGGSPEDYLTIDEDDGLQAITPHFASPLRPREAFFQPARREVAPRFWREEVERLEGVATDPSTDDSYRELLRDQIFRARLAHLIARYSRGDALPTLAPEFPGVLDALAAFRSEPRAEPLALEYRENYVSCMWLLSLAVLLRIDDPLFDRLLLLLDQSGRDVLFDWLVTYRRPGRPVCPDLLHPLPYTPLRQMLDAGGPQRSALVQRFLTEYYPAMADLSWYDLHLRAAPAFFGYWCFELAALVVCAGVRDAAFADHYLYPRDLTGQRLFRTWQDSTEGETDRLSYQRYSEEFGLG